MEKIRCESRIIVELRRDERPSCMVWATTRDHSWVECTRGSGPRKSHDLVSEQEMGEHSECCQDQFSGVGERSIQLTVCSIQHLASSMLAPAVPVIMGDFHTSSTTFAIFVVSICVLAFACAPLLLGSLSEFFSRVIVYNVTNVLLVSSNILCPISRNEAMLLVFRFLAGFAGVATITVGSRKIADIMPQEKRGRAVSIGAISTVVGPMVGPIIGGYVTADIGWRWMF